MGAGVLVALISAAVAVCSAAFTAYATARSIRLQHTLTLSRSRLERQQASDDLIRRYREPLLLAAFDLQARIYNIVCMDFVARHTGSSDPEERHYARASTLYRLGNYFGWIEILRRGLQFLDLGEEAKTHELVERLDIVSHTFANTEWFPAGAFRLFCDEQRALGEVMLEPVEGDLRRYQCIGYATFVDRLAGESGFACWFDRLGREFDKLGDPAPRRIDRLIELHNALIHVIYFLDPEGLRFPKAHLKLLDPPAVAVSGGNDDRPAG